jgi:hypothetical protein
VNCGEWVLECCVGVRVGVECLCGVGLGEDGGDAGISNTYTVSDSMGALLFPPHEVSTLAKFGRVSVDIMCGQEAGLSPMS